MDYKAEQKKWRERAKPKLLAPEKYTEHDKQVAANLTNFFARAQRRKRMKGKKAKK